MQNDTTQRKLVAIIAMLAFALMVLMNGLANALPLNGVNTGQLSDEIPNLFVPAGITFAIWGLIYALLLGYVITVLVTAFGAKSQGPWKAVDGWIFSINAFLNAGWIFAWHWRLVPLSLLLMAGILFTLVLLTERGFKAGWTERGAKKFDIRGFFLRTPILVYLGWICVATIANVTAVLVKAGWNGFGLDPLWWAVIVITVGMMVSLSLVLRRGAVSSGLVVIWAYAGIIIKRSGLDFSDTLPIVIAASLGIVLSAGAIVVRLVENRRSGGKVSSAA